MMTMPPLSHTKNRFVVATAAALMLLAVPACSGGGSSQSGAPTSDSAKAEQKLAIAAESFRQMGSTDLLLAFKAYSTPDANVRFAELARLFLPGEDWQTNYPVFLSSALTNIIDGSPEAPVVGYYHPWSDVMLITEWAKDGDSYRIAKVDILPGAFVRGTPQQMTAQPAWMLREAYAPQAVAEVTAQTITAFRSSYAKGGKGPMAAVPADLRIGMPAAAGASFDQFRYQIAPIFADMPATRRLMRDWLFVQAEAASGTTKRDGRVGDGVKVLATLDPAIRKSFTPVAFIDGEAAQVMILVSKLEPGITVTLRATKKDGKATLDRVDVMGLASVMNALENKEAVQ